jgi:hypothetical protein
MKTTRKLHELGQSIWLYNITRDLPNGGRCGATSMSGR